jgi:oxygen-independent coproporphyrinogen-3 oxidase
VAGGARQATAAERNPERWATLVEARGHGLAGTVALTPAEEADEALLMGLRLSEGIDLDRLAALTGFVPGDGAVAELAGLGLVERCGEARVRATAAGRIVLDRVVLRLASALVRRERA